jgi:hypothetical protein
VIVENRPGGEDADSDPVRRQLHHLRPVACQFAWCGSTIKQTLKWGGISYRRWRT